MYDSWQKSHLGDQEGPTPPACARLLLMTLAWQRWRDAADLAFLLQPDFPQLAQAGLAMALTGARQASDSSSGSVGETGSSVADVMGGLHKAVWYTVSCTSDACLTFFASL